MNLREAHEEIVRLLVESDGHITEEVWRRCLELAQARLDMGMEPGDFLRDPGRFLRRQGIPKTPETEE